MIISEDFLVTKFTDVSLLHILVLLGIPYVIFYFFERFTEFDKFVEKWEGALFIFSIGGIISLASISLQSVLNISFSFIYSIFILFLIMTLWIIQLKYYPNSKIKNSLGWVKVKMNNGDIYTGNLLEADSEYIKLGSTVKDKLKKIISRNRQENLKAKEIIINRDAVSIIFYY